MFGSVTSLISSNVTSLSLLFTKMTEKSSLHSTLGLKLTSLSKTDPTSTFEKVIVVSVTSPHDFIFRRIGEDVYEKMLQICSDSSSPLDESKVVPGVSCFWKGENGKGFRVEIERAERGRGVVLVTKLDEGGSREVVPITDLFELPRFIHKIPPLAIRAKLIDIENRLETWDESLLRPFRRLMTSYDPQTAPLYLRIVVGALRLEDPVGVVVFDEIGSISEVVVSGCTDSLRLIPGFPVYDGKSEESEFQDVEITHVNGIHDFYLQKIEEDERVFRKVLAEDEECLNFTPWNGTDQYVLYGYGRIKHRAKVLNRLNDETITIQLRDSGRIMDHIQASSLKRCPLEVSQIPDLAIRASLNDVIDDFGVDSATVIHVFRELVLTEEPQFRARFLRKNKTVDKSSVELIDRENNRSIKNRLEELLRARADGPFQIRHLPLLDTLQVGDTIFFVRTSDSPQKIIIRKEKQSEFFSSLNNYTFPNLQPLQTPPLLKQLVIVKNLRGEIVRLGKDQCYDVRMFDIGKTFKDVPFQVMFAFPKALLRYPELCYVVKCFDTDIRCNEKYKIQSILQPNTVTLKPFSH